MVLDKRDIMGGFAKGLRVIEAFTAETPKMTIAQTADKAQLDRATARRCLLTLVELGYCAFDGKFFTVTPRVLRLGIGCLATMPLPKIIQPLLDQLSEKIKQSTSVSILDETEIVYIARSAQTRVMTIALMPGSRLPVFCTSMGRILLSAMSDDEAKSILSKSNLEQRTEYTLTNIKDIVIELKKIRQQGYAYIDQEVEIGLRSIAVPLQNNRGKTIAAMNIGIPASLMSMQEAIKQYLPALQQVQKECLDILV